MACLKTPVCLFLSEGDASPILAGGVEFPDSDRSPALRAIAPARTSGGVRGVSPIIENCQRIKVVG